MADCELIEAAAKAAGYDFRWGTDWHEKGCPLVGGREWYPLDDDAAALRLAVKLRIGMVPLEGGGWDCVRFDAETSRERTLASCANSGDWALRECIVRAAASLLPDGGPR